MACLCPGRCKGTLPASLHLFIFFFIIPLSNLPRFLTSSSLAVCIRFSHGAGAQQEVKAACATAAALCVQLESRSVSNKTRRPVAARPFPHSRFQKTGQVKKKKKKDGAADFHLIYVPKWGQELCWSLE